MSELNRHVDEMTCLQYLEGLLERPRALEFSAHTANCPECRALMRALERETRMLSSALREQEEAVPARLLQAPGRERTPWGWIVSFGLAGGGVYWLWSGIMEPALNRASEAGLGVSDFLTTLFFNGALWKGWGNMWTMIQVLGVISLGAVGYYLLRRSFRRFNTIALVMGALVVALGLPAGASAAEIHRTEPNYTLPADSTVKNDLIVFGNSIRIEGTVDGDLIVFGQSLTMNGHVTGDIIVFGSFLELNGTVDGNVRGCVNQMAVHGKIGKNVTAFGSMVSLGSKSEVGWSATVFASSLSMDGRIGRDILAYSGDANLDGYVGGNGTITGRNLTVGSETQTQGKLKYTGARQPTVSSGAKLASPIDVTIESRSSRDYVYSSTSIWHTALMWGAAFVFGLLLLLVAPDFFNQAVQNTERFGVSLGFGAMVLVATPILAVLVCITVVGLAVGISTLLLYVIAIYGVKVFVAVWLGKKILFRSGGKTPVFGHIGGRDYLKQGSGALVAQLALGLLICYALRLVPYAGFWLALAVAMWGLGALALTVYDRIRSTPVEAAAA